jgi:hypothetical protein
VILRRHDLVFMVLWQRVMDFLKKNICCVCYDWVMKNIPKGGPNAEYADLTFGYVEIEVAR